MQPFVFYSLAVAITLAITLLVAKYTVNKTFKDISVYLFYFFLLRIVAVPFLLVKVPLGDVSVAILPAFLAALFWVTAITILYQALVKIDASITGSLFPLKLIFIPFVAYFLIGELFSVRIYLWFIPLILGGFLVAMDERMKWSSFFTKDVGIVLLSMLFFAFSDTFGKMGVDHIGSLPYLVLFLLFVPILSSAFIPFVRKNLALTKQQLAGVSLVVLFDITVNLFFILALADNVTLTNAIAMLNAPFLLIFTFLLSRFKPDLLETHPPRVYVIRFAGVLVMYFAAVQIVFA